jgi:hypothetical protein
MKRPKRTLGKDAKEGQCTMYQSTKRTKRKEDKKKVTFHQENYLPKSASKRTRSKRIPQVSPKEQEATKFPPPLRPIRSQ